MNSVRPHKRFLILARAACLVLMVALLANPSIISKILPFDLLKACA